MHYGKKEYFRIKTTVVNADGNPTGSIKYMWASDWKTTSGVGPDGSDYSLHVFQQVAKDGDLFTGKYSTTHILDGELLVTKKPAVMNLTLGRLEIA
tara:strand:- start:190 stop:477 length:288 start_codon:yes stop_codon:yes gene_type:complete